MRDAACKIEEFLIKELATTAGWQNCQTRHAEKESAD